MSHALAYPKTMTVEEFLSWPGDGYCYLHQLIDGEPVAMNPPSNRHGIILAAIGFLLGAHFRTIGSPCRVSVNPGVRPRAGAANNVRVPDIGVSCTPALTHLMADPVLLVEVLSPSNKRETREAIRAYTTIPSVQEILLLDSLATLAELLRRQPDGNWPAEPLRLRAGDALELTSVEFRCPLDEVYA